MAARRDPKLHQLASPGRLRIAACYPRAVRALFAAAGSPLPPDTKFANMRTQTAAEVQAVLTDAPETAATAPSSQTDPHDDVPQATTGAWKAWFPVIDFSRCTNCMQCLSFCLFDVFAVDADRKITVKNPSNCKTECPACSRVCPEVAIIFPKYRASPINGDDVNPDDLRRQNVKIDVSSLLGGDIYGLLKDRSAKSRSRFSRERDENRALEERRRCLARLQEQMGVPDEVVSSIIASGQLPGSAKNPTSNPEGK